MVGRGVAECARAYAVGDGLSERVFALKPVHVDVGAHHFPEFAHAHMVALFGCASAPDIAIQHIEQHAGMDALYKRFVGDAGIECGGE